eukprot:3254460-Pyramimonas_sp.AAC.2
MTALPAQSYASHAIAIGKGRSSAEGRMRSPSALPCSLLETISAHQPGQIRILERRPRLGIRRHTSTPQRIDDATGQASDLEAARGQRRLHRQELRHEEGFRDGRPREVMNCPRPSASDVILSLRPGAGGRMSESSEPELFMISFYPLDLDREMAEVQGQLFRGPRGSRRDWLRGFAARKDRQELPGPRSKSWGVRPEHQQAGHPRKLTMKCISGNAV